MISKLKRHIRKSLGEDQMANNKNKKKDNIILAVAVDEDDSKIIHPIDKSPLNKHLKSSSVPGVVNDVLIVGHQSPIQRKNAITTASRPSEVTLMNVIEYKKMIKKLNIYKYTLLTIVAVPVITLNSIVLTSAYFTMIIIPIFTVYILMLFLINHLVSDRLFLLW